MDAGVTDYLSGSLWRPSIRRWPTSINPSEARLRTGNIVSRWALHVCFWRLFGNPNVDLVKLILNW